MTKRRRKIPTETFDNYVLLDVERKFPSLECLTSSEIKELDSRIRRIINFESRARIPELVVSYISEMLSSRGFAEGDLNNEKPNSNKRKYFFKDPWMQSSMIVVKKGRESIKNGFNLIVCHGDSPCLRIKPKPLRAECVENEIYNFLGTRLTANLCGGSQVYHWMGSQVRILGNMKTKKGRIPVNIPGMIGIPSAHIDESDEEVVRLAFPKNESLEVIPGHSSVRETLKRFEIQSQDDFASSRLFVVPVTDPHPVDEYNWRLLGAYGHDDKSCVYAAVDALSKVRDPKRTSIVWITDKEEVGDDAPTGAGGPLLEKVLDRLIRGEEVKSRKKMSESEKRNMHLKSCLLIGDVTAAPYGYDAEQMDIENTAKLGFGVYISGDSKETSDADFIWELRNLAKMGASRDINICHQVTGDFYHPDSIYAGFGCREHSGKEDLYKKIGRWAWVGIPCASTHSHNEVICPADEMWTSRFYKRFFGSDLSLK